jgi:hypothetical protein
MLTGDNENTIKAVDELHLTSFIAGCLPEDKLKEIKDYKTKVKLWPWQETELMMLRIGASRYRYCDGNRNRCSNAK